MAFTMDSLPWSASKATYTDDEWSDVWRKLYLRDRTTQGVLSGYLNEMAVSNPSGVTIRVATGAALVDGKFTESDTQRDFTVVAPGAGSNFYRIVLQKVWADEDVYLDILGPDVAAPPAVTQTDGTTWEISLGSVEITSASVVTVTDTVEFVFTRLVPSRTQKFFVPMVGGYNMSDSIALPIQEVDAQSAGWNFVDNKICVGFGDFIVPRDFVSDMKVKAVVMNSESSIGDVVAINYALYGECADIIYRHSASNAAGFIGTAGSDNNCVAEMTLSSAADDDIVRLRFKRTGTSAADTLGEDLYVIGWIVEYISDH